MSGSTELEDVRTRCAAIRLSHADLADMASLDVTTVARTLSGKTSPRWGTFTKIREALDLEERRLLAVLAARHGVAPDALERAP